MANIYTTTRLLRCNGEKYQAGDKIDIDAVGLDSSAVDNLASIGVLVKPQTSKGKTGGGKDHVNINRIAEIADDIRAMLEDDPAKVNKGWWTKDGLPAAGASGELEKRFKGEVTADERNHALELIEKK